MGYAHAAGFRGQPRSDAAGIAEYFSVPPDRLARALTLAETGDRPEILLLQQADPDAKVAAAVFFSSVWSRSYEKFGTPYGRIHRDYHYQVQFAALAALVEVGCARIRIENPMSGYAWRKDAYVCLVEAMENVRRHIAKVAVHLAEGCYDPGMPKDVDGHMARYDLQDHRPVGISPHMFEGLNMRMVFV